MSEKFGVVTAVAVGVGGIVGGGIYAAIGIVVGAAGYLTWLAYAIAAVVVFGTAYSYVNLNQLIDEDGGSVTFIEALTDRSTAAAVIGWTLVVGYIGTMAMYAYAFGAFAEFLLGMSSAFGVPVRPFLSALIVVVFIGLNLLGAGSSTSVERYLVVIQAGIIAVFGLWALYFNARLGQFQVGLSEFGLNPFIAGAVSFVSFEGWQLLFYDQEQFEDPAETLSKGVFIAIGIAALIYVLVGFVITNLVPPETITAQPEAGLVFAALEINQWLALGIIIAALVSTASAINATLFSEALFAKHLIDDDILPDRLGGTGHGDVPSRTIVVLGVCIILFTVWGSLEGIVEFASLTFIAVYGSVNAIALVNRDDASISAIPPGIGLVGSVAFFILLLRHLYFVKRPVFNAVVLIAIAVFAVEALYFKRGVIEEGAEELEEQV